MIVFENGELLGIIRKKLDKYFSQEELNTICFDLGIDYESLPGKGKSAKTRELVIFCERTGRMPQLLQEVAPLRSNAGWPELHRV